MITEERLRKINERRRQRGKPAMTMKQAQTQYRSYSSSGEPMDSFDDFLMDCVITIAAQGWSSGSTDYSSSSSSYDFGSSSSSSYDSGSSSSFDSGSSY